jgi:ABC-2 type transport system permease protein
MTDLAARPAPSAVNATVVTMKLFLGQLVTPARVAALTAMGLLVSALGLVARQDDDPVAVSAGLVANLGLAVVVPIVVLVLATATLGEMRQERTLVYLWLRPIPRWSIALGALLATLIVATPISIVPLILSVVLAGETSLIGPVVLATVMAVIGYSGLFVTLGVAVGRAFLVGLGYVLVWEGLIARAGGGFAKMSILSYASSVIEHLGDVDIGGVTKQTLALSIIVPVGVLLAGCALTAWLLGRREVD